tara:strand:- start:350 stop:2218 length:1869 start_codon:yes stop_codon:yes gene_type:complete
MPSTYTDNGGGAANGSKKIFTYTFPILKTEDVKVSLNGVTQATTKYTVDTTTNPTQIEFNNTSIDSTLQESTGAPKSGVDVRIYRQTTVGKISGDDDPRVVFSQGSVIRSSDLNANTEQALYAIHELQDQPIEAPELQDGSVTSSKIVDGAIVNADVNAAAAIEGSKLQAASSSNAGSMSASDKSKLDTIEFNAKNDQTGAEIKALYEGESNTNAYTDAEKTKLQNIEPNSTADQTGAEIKTAYEGEANTNAFTDTEQSKLAGIASGAEVNVNADWNSNSGNSEILNKPSLVTGINDLSDVDTTGVADNKILKYQASSSKFVIADDTGGGGGSSTFTGLSDSPTNYTGAAGKTVKVNSTADGVEFVDVNTDLDQDSSPQLAANLDVQTHKITTSTTNGDIVLDPNGTGVVQINGDGTPTGDGGTLELRCSNGNHGVKIKSPPHSSGASYTLTLPDDDGNANQVLKTDGTGGLSWVDQTTYTAGSGLTLTGTSFSVNTLNQNTTGSAATLTTPRNIAGVAFDGSADITLNNSNITNGAGYIDGSTLNAANLTGALPAIDGSALYGVGGGLVGGSNEELFVEAENQMDNDFTTTASKNYLSASPLTIVSGVTLTVVAGSTMTYV